MSNLSLQEAPTLLATLKTYADRGFLQVSSLLDVYCYVVKMLMRFLAGNFGVLVVSQWTVRGDGGGFGSLHATPILNPSLG